MQFWRRCNWDRQGRRREDGGAGYMASALFTADTERHNVAYLEGNLGGRIRGGPGPLYYFNLYGQARQGSQVTLQSEQRVSLNSKTSP